MKHPARSYVRLRPVSLLLPVLLALFLPPSVHAATIVSVAGPIISGFPVFTNQTVGVSWAQPRTYGDVRIFARLLGGPPNDGGTAYLTTRIGPGTTAAHAITQSSFQFPNTGTDDRDVLLFSGLTLTGGTYYVTLVNAAPADQGGWWATAEPVVTVDAGVTVGTPHSIGAFTPRAAYPPASAFQAFTYPLKFTVIGVAPSPPAIFCPSNIVVSCRPSNTAIVTYSVPATNAVGPPPVVSCAPPSGSVFPAGLTTVSCIATNSGGSNSCSFTVQVIRDTAAPVISCSTNIVVNTYSTNLPNLTFTVSVQDACDPAPVVACVPPSGSPLPGGITTVNCRATDAAGNSNACSFTVLNIQTIQSTAPPTIPTRLGDLDADGRPTVLDLQRLLNHINGSATLALPLRGYADLTGDGYINQADVDLLANAILGIPITTVLRPLIAEPSSGASEVGVTVRPRVYFPKPILPGTLNSNNFYASFAGRKLPARIVPANDGTFAWLFLDPPMPSASQIQVTVDGSTISVISGEILDADADIAPGGRFNFSTVSITPIPNTVLSSRIVDPGPDLIPRTADDVTLGNGFNYLLPIAGVKVYVLGLESNFAYTGADGRFTLTNMPVGDVKVVLDGRTATSPHAGYYFPEMVMDTTFEPGITNGVMNIVDTNGVVVRDGNGVPIRALAMYLPRIASNVLQTVSATNTTMITLQSNAAYTLSETQRQYLTLEIMPGSLIGLDGQPMASGQVGISVVPPELVRDMLPPGLLQHTFDITVQAPGISTFATPAPMTFPNVFNAPREPVH